MKFYRVNNPFLHADTSVSIDGSVLRFQWENLNNQNSSGTFGDVSLDFNELKQHPGFADHTLWVLSEAKQKWIPIFAETAINKETLSEYAKDNGNLLASLFVRLATDSLDDCCLSVALSTDSTLDVGENVVTPAESTASIYGLAFPQLQIGEPTFENGIASFPIALLDENGAPLSQTATAYCEATIGALLTSRVNLVDGVGSIKVYVNGLGGTAGKVKAGFKFFSGVAERSFTA